MSQPFVHLVTGRVQDFPPQMAAQFPQLEAVPDGVAVLRGGDATLSDGVDLSLRSAGGATLSGEPVILRGGGA